MKRKKIPESIKNLIKSSNERDQLSALYAVAIVSCLFYLVFLWRYHEGCDTYEFKGIDHLRTPVYPLFLMLSWKWPIASILQYVIYLFSVKFFYKIVREIFSSNSFVFYTTLLYVIHPVFLMYHNNLQTESLALSGSVIYLYLLMQCLYHYRHKYCLFYHLIVLLLILLRPGFIYLLPVSGIVFLKQVLEKHKRELLVVFSTFIVVLAVVGSYMSVIYMKYGVFSLTSVSDINLYWMLRERNMIESDNVNDVNLKSYLVNHKNVYYCPREFWKYYDEGVEIVDKFGWTSIHSVVQNSLRNNTMQFIFRGNKVYELELPVGVSSRDYCQHRYLKFIASFSINSFELLFVLISYFVLLIVCFFKERKTPWLSLSFLLIVSMHFMSLFLLAPNNYGRLLLPSTPIILIVLMQIVWFFYSFAKHKTIKAQFI